MYITDKELKQLAEKEACEMWGHFSTGEIHRAYFIDAYTKGFREALKQVKNNGVSVRFLFDFVNEFTDIVIPVEAIEETFKRLNEH